MGKGGTSETRFLLEALKTVALLIPGLFLEKIREMRDESWGRMKEFIHEEEATFTLITIIITTSIIGWFLPEHIIDKLVQRPSDIFASRWHTLITAGFLHGNIGHLLGNMLALFIFGRQVENGFGAKRFLSAYFAALIISGVLSSVANYASGIDVAGLGASGAIMGIVALAMLIRPLTITYILILPLPIAAVGWLYILADIAGLLGPADGIGHLAHLGGFLSVALTAYLIGKKDREEMKKGALICLGTLLVMGVIKASLL